jgi:hypothetical protein
MLEREVLQLLKALRKSEHKLRRRGFFRTKVVENKQAVAAGASARALKGPVSRPSRTPSGAKGDLTTGSTVDSAPNPPEPTSRQISQAEARREAGAKVPDDGELRAGPVRSRTRTRVMSPTKIAAPPPIRPAPPPPLPPRGPSSTADPLPLPSQPTRPHITTVGLADRPPSARSTLAAAGSAAVPAAPSATLLPGASFAIPGGSSQSLPAASAPLANAPQRLPRVSEPSGPLSATPRSLPPPLPDGANTAPRAPEPMPNLATLPPAIAASLARLAGSPVAATPAPQPAGVLTMAGADAAATDHVASKPLPLPTRSER